MTELRFLVSLITQDNDRSEEHTSELQSQSNLVCRLLLEKKKIASFASISFSASPSPRGGGRTTEPTPPPRLPLCHLVRASAQWPTAMGLAAVAPRSLPHV